MSEPSLDWPEAPSLRASAAAETHGAHCTLDDMSYGVYIYIYIYVYMYMYVHVCIYIYINIDVYSYTHCCLLGGICLKWQPTYVHLYHLPPMRHDEAQMETIAHANPA